MKCYRCVLKCLLLLVTIVQNVALLITFTALGPSGYCIFYFCTSDDSCYILEYVFACEIYLSIYFTALMSMNE